VQKSYMLPPTNGQNRYYDEFLQRKGLATLLVCDGYNCASCKADRKQSKRNLRIVLSKSTATAIWQQTGTVERLQSGKKQALWNACNDAHKCRCLKASACRSQTCYQAL
jgi:hypothetical protein